MFVVVPWRASEIKKNWDLDERKFDSPKVRESILTQAISCIFLSPISVMFFLILATIYRAPSLIQHLRQVPALDGHKVICKHFIQLIYDVIPFAFFVALIAVPWRFACAIRDLCKKLDLDEIKKEDRELSLFLDPKDIFNTQFKIQSQRRHYVMQQFYSAFLDFLALISGLVVVITCYRLPGLLKELKTHSLFAPPPPLPKDGWSRMQGHCIIIGKVFVIIGEAPFLAMGAAVLLSWRGKSFAYSIIDNKDSSQRCGIACTEFGALLVDVFFICLALPTILVPWRFVVLLIDASSVTGAKNIRYAICQAFILCLFDILMLISLPIVLISCYRIKRIKRQLKNTPFFVPYFIKSTEKRIQIISGYNDMNQSKDGLEAENDQKMYEICASNLPKLSPTTVMKIMNPDFCPEEIVVEQEIVAGDNTTVDEKMLQRNKQKKEREMLISNIYYNSTPLIVRMYPLLVVIFESLLVLVDLPFAVISLFFVLSPIRVFVLKVAFSQEPVPYKRRFVVLIQLVLLVLDLLSFPLLLIVVLTAIRARELNSLKQEFQTDRKRFFFSLIPHKIIFKTFVVVVLDAPFLVIVLPVICTLWRVPTLTKELHQCKTNNDRRRTMMLHLGMWVMDIFAAIAAVIVTITFVRATQMWVLLRKCWKMTDEEWAELDQYHGDAFNKRMTQYTTAEEGLEVMVSIAFIIIILRVSQSELLNANLSVETKG